MWVVPPVDGLVENSLAPIIWVDGIGAISLIDDVVVMHYFAKRDSLSGDGTEKTVELIVKKSVRRFIADLCVVASATKLFIDIPSALPQVRPPNGWKPRVV